MNAVLKIILPVFSLFALCWSIVQFDKRQKTMGIVSSSSSKLRLTSSGVRTRKLLFDNFSSFNSSEVFFNTEPPEKPCIELHKFCNKTQQCSFIKTQRSCKMSKKGFFWYLKFPYCTIPSIPAVAFILMILWMIYLIRIKGSIADDYFCPSLIVLYKTLRISESTAGVTFLAIGNGASDILSSVAAFSDNRSGGAELAFNSLFGAGIFLTTFLVGAISFTGCFTISHRPFIRNTIFYAGGAAWAFITFHKKSITLFQAMGFIILYIAFVFTVVVGRYIYEHLGSRLSFLAKKTHLPKATPQESLYQSGESNEDSDDSDIEVNSPSCEQNLLTNSEEEENPLKKNPHHNFSAGLDTNHCQNGSDISKISVGESCLSNSKEEKKPAEKSLDHSIVVDERTPLIDSFKFRTLTPWMKFWKGIQPWNDSEWSKGGIIRKALIILDAPAILCLKLTIPVVDLNKDNQNWNKWLNVFHCLIDPVFCVLMTHYAQYKIVYMFPLWALMLSSGVILALIVAMSTSDDTPPKFHRGFSFIAFVISVIWIYTTAQEVVNLLQALGIAFKISDGILGLTFLAWGNSIADIITNLAVARHGCHRMALSACFGTPLQDLTLGIGLGCFAAIISSGRNLQLRHETNQYIISAGFLALSLASSAIFIPLMGFKIPRPYGVYLILLYIAYLTVSITEEITRF